MQRAAAQAVASAYYRAGGTVPLLELIGAADPFKPRASWKELRRQLGARVTTVVIDIDDASHALFPEQPDRVADAVRSWAASFLPAEGSRDRANP